MWINSFMIGVKGMIKRYLSLSILFSLLILLSGCAKINILLFEDFQDLPAYPDRIVYVTNIENYDEVLQTYGDTIKYEIPTDKLKLVMESLLSIGYKAYPYSDTEEGTLIEYLMIYNYNGDSWKVNLGIIEDNGTWYAPINQNPLKDLIDDVKIKFTQGVYRSQDKTSSLILYGNNKFYFYVNIDMSDRPEGYYTIVDHRILLEGQNDESFTFLVFDNSLVFFRGTLISQSVEVGTIYELETDDVSDYH